MVFLHPVKGARLCQAVQLQRAVAAPAADQVEGGEQKEGLELSTEDLGEFLERKGTVDQAQQPDPGQRGIRGAGPVRYAADQDPGGGEAGSQAEQAHDHQPAVGLDQEQGPFPESLLPSNPLQQIHPVRGKVPEAEPHQPGPKGRESGGTAGRAEPVKAW